MAWESKTKQFSVLEISYLETARMENLIQALLNSATKKRVVLRILAELMLHDDERLKGLLENDAITAKWSDYRSEPGIDPRDYDYASALKQRLDQLKSKPTESE